MNMPKLSSSSKAYPNSIYIGVRCINFFFHFDLSWSKSSDRLYFFRSIFTTSIPLIFGKPLPLGRPLTYIEKTFFTSVVVSLYWTFPNHLKLVFSYILTNWHYPQRLVKALISYSILANFTIHLSQNSHLC